MKSAIALLKERRTLTKKHIIVAELPKDEQFRRLSTQSKYFIDTIKMIAYRTEASMANLLREKISHPNEASTLLRAIYNTDADILPDYDAETLTIWLHQIANRMSGKPIRCLCDELNTTETVFPGTNLRMIYELVT